MNGQEVILEIKGGNKKVLLSIYQLHRNSFILWSLKKYACSQELAQDAFQYAILCLYKNINDGRLVQLDSGLKSYLYAIGKNYILKGFNKAKKVSSVSLEVLQEYAEEEITDDHEDRFELVKRGLSQMGNPCQDLIVKSYIEQKNITQLTAELGYKNNDVTKNQKYKCMERLRTFVKENFREN